MTGAALRVAEELRVPEELHELQVATRRLWAAMMLALRIEVAESILFGLPVLVSRLDATVLRRALRGARLPDSEAYIVVTGEMLDAAAEAGPLSPKKRGGRRR